MTTCTDCGKGHDDEQYYRCTDCGAALPVKA